MSGVQLFDSHCHWQHPRLQALQPQLWQSCVQHGVSQLLVPATTADTWSAQISLCNQNPSWHCALGLHPYFIEQHQTADLQRLAELVQQHQPVAIGEIGLDWHLPDHTWEAQEQWFLAQLQLAKDYDRPLILHVRKCHDRVIKLLKQHRFSLGGFVHAFSGNEQQAHAYAKLGFKLGFGGTITYPRASKTRALAANLPLEYLVLETDAPDMPMFSDSLNQGQHASKGPQGGPNRPDYLPQVLTVLAGLRPETAAQIATQTCANVQQVLNLRDRLREA